MKIAWLPVPADREKIFGLDAFRGLAALLVFLYHYWTWYRNGEEIHFLGLNVTAPFAAGHLGVDIFFVLSGFLIFLSLVGSSSLRDYFRRRFLRLLPLAWTFTIVLFLVRRDFTSVAWFDFGAHLLFLQGFFRETYHGLNPVMWTLSVEMAFYLLLPVLLFLGRKKLWHFLTLLFVLTSLSFFYRAEIQEYFPQWSAFDRIFFSEQLWGRFDQFALGIGLGLFWVFRGQLRKYVQKISSILLIGGLGGFLFLVSVFSKVGSSFREVAWMQIGLHGIIGFFFALFLLGYLFSSRRWQQIFTPSFLVFGGVISYSFYLWHFPVLAAVHRMVPEAKEGFISAFLLTLIASSFSYFLVEKPFLRKKVEKTSGIP